MVLDISPLNRATARLEEAIVAYQQDSSQLLIRDGLVQRFEFTYDTAHRLLRRSLRSNAVPPEDFCESDLPFRVDILDWATATPAFRRVVEQDKVIGQRGKSDHP